MDRSHITFVNTFSISLISIFSKWLNIASLLKINDCSVLEFDDFWISHNYKTNELFDNMFDLLYFFVIVVIDLLEVYFFGFVYLDFIFDLVYGGGKFKGGEIFVVVISDACIEVVSREKGFFEFFW